MERIENNFKINITSWNSISYCTHKMKNKKGNQRTKKNAEHLTTTMKNDCQNKKSSVQSLGDKVK